MLLFVMHSTICQPFGRGDGGGGPFGASGPFGVGGIGGGGVHVKDLSVHVLVL
jgi:hypothetical protein